MLELIAWVLAALSAGRARRRKGIPLMAGT